MNVCVSSKYRPGSLGSAVGGQLPSGAAGLEIFPSCMNFWGVSWGKNKSDYSELELCQTIPETLEIWGTKYI